MKFFLAVLLIALLSFAAGLYLPWWMIAVVAFAVIAFVPLRPLSAFFAAFLAIFLLWGGLSLYISTANEHVLAHRVSLLILKLDNPVALMVVTALIGGLVAGFAGLTASFIRPRVETVSRLNG
ncbi:MAG: hypothetical protein JWQ27_110 [Ferruginibacter sp.]|nr:hypothetical protein [Ferruginibacter sp.]